MKYTGETNSKGEPHVQCTFTYLSSKYTGERKDGIFNGQGTSTYPNGDKYVGEWKDGLPNGHGTYTEADGNKYVGKWKDGKPVP